MPLGAGGVSFTRRISRMGGSNKDNVPRLYVSLPPEIARYVKEGNPYEVTLNLLGTVAIGRPRMKPKREQNQMVVWEA